ncbi:uncharacterized protein L201_007321 [Kwoniella dendrophila CBS 6074]|uniref:Inositol-1-monophosphatase n=1 Tax=Kwoniella dendrophila CBS 6074 TaxID=1295534 RepID=A0AAX4K5F1_9TREE
MSSQLDLDSILEFTINLALEAGELIRSGQQRRFSSESANEDEKANSVDLVTEVDKAVEDFITKKIKETYPDHQFIGEETFKGQKITDEPTWIDGTTNFIHGFPMVATSIGLAYSAAKGKGAYLNRKTKLPITGKSKPLQSLGRALIAVEYGSARSAPQLPSKVKTFQTLAGAPELGGKMCHSLRSMGSAALNIAAVASGGLDMYWEVGCWAWDVCAGICILREAGGVMFGPKTSTLSGDIDGDLLTGRKYLAVRGIAPTADETSLQVQQRFAKEFYDTTDDIEP